MILAPRWVASAGFTIEGPVGNSGLLAGLAIDGRYSSNYATLLSRAPEAVQDGYVSLDASFTLSPLESDGGWELALVGRNLTNEAVATSAVERPVTGSGAGRVAPGTRADQLSIVQRKRQIALRASYKF